MFALLTRKAAALLPDFESQVLEEFGEAKGRRVLLLTRIFFAALSIPCALFAGLLLGKLLWVDFFKDALVGPFGLLMCFLVFSSLKTRPNVLYFFVSFWTVLFLLGFYSGMDRERYYALGRFLFPGL
jgi:hypothetical protein